MSWGEVREGVKSFVEFTQPMATLPSRACQTARAPPRTRAPIVRTRLRTTGDES